MPSLNRMWKSLSRVIHEGDAAAHAGREIASRWLPITATTPPVMYSQPWSPTALNHRPGAAVADGRTVRRRVRVDEGTSPSGGSIKGHVADDDVVLRARKGGAFGMRLR